MAHRGGVAWCWGWCRSTLALFTRVVISTATLALLFGVLLWLRLTQGPIELPGLGKYGTELINSQNADYQVAMEGLVLTLGRAQDEPGLQARNLTVSDKSGVRLFTIPRASVRFALADLVNGRVQPVRMTFLEPTATLERDADGRLVFGLGQGEGIELSSGNRTAGNGTSDDLNEEEVRLALDTLTGAESNIALLEKLERIEIADAQLTYRDRRTGSEWGTKEARIEVWRYDEGARALLSVNRIHTGTPGASVRVFAERDRETGAARIQAAYGQLSMQDVAAQLPELAWLEIIEGTTEGQALVRLDRDGEVLGLSGAVIAEKGQLRGYGPETGFDFAQVRFSLDTARERLRFEEVTLDAPALSTKLTGLASLKQSTDGAILGLAGQLDVAALYVDLPEVFSEALTFDDGQINFRWKERQQVLEVDGARLSNGPLTFAVDGRASAGEDGWITDIRAETTDMSIRDLLAHWPIAAAKNARDWIETNITEAHLGRLLAQMRFGQGEPYLSLDFDYERMDASYITGMSPITDASGRVHMSFHDMFMDMDEGTITPRGGREISIAGSTAEIREFWGEVTPADVRLIARGRTADVLRLMDEEPLGMISRLGLRPSVVGGRALVEANVAFPLVSGLAVEDVGARATARLDDLALPFELRPGQEVAVRANRLSLAADTDGMTLRGPVSVDGVPLRLEWSERYGVRPTRRRVALDGQAGANLRAKLGLDGLPISGAAPFDMVVEQSGGGPLAFTLESNLTGARLDLDALGWSKPKGQAARLRVRGKARDGLEIDSFRLSSGSFEANGSVRVDAGGRLADARLERLVVPGLADVAGTLRPGRDGVLEVNLTRGTLDVSQRIEDAGDDDAGGDPFRLSFALRRLRLSDKIALNPARGRIARDTQGAVKGEIAGSLGPGAEVSIDVNDPAQGPGSVSIRGSDAGAVLEAADLYRGARGGRLLVDASLGEGGGMTGRMRIEDVVVRSEATFRDVLRDGGLSDAGAAVSSSGLSFRKIWVPFTYRDGQITLTDAIATSPALALKMNGTVNEATDQMDLYGVMSPAYVLTGALNEIPVIGDILSGGEGEGILAMTFTLRGATRDPEFSVNPLSVLAPGFLRRVFTGGSGGGGGSEAFEQRIRREDP